MDSQAGKKSGKKRKKETKKVTIDARDLSPVQIPRCGVFQPTRRPEFQSREYITKWGSFTVSGRLGQAHQDLLEASIKYAEIHEIVDNRLGLLIDLSVLRKVLSKSNDRANLQQIIDLYEEMRKASVVRNDNMDKSKTFSGIVSEHGYAMIEKELSNRANKTTKTSSDGKIYYYKVELSANWTELMLGVTTDYRGKLQNILSLRRGVLQACSRFMLSHKPGAKYKITDVFEILGIEGRQRDRLDELDEGKEALAEMDVIFDGQYMSS